MSQFNNHIGSAKTWATGHIVAASAICFAVGFVVHMLLF